MADIEISNFDAGEDVSSIIKEAEALVDEAISLTEQANSKLPSQIKGSISTSSLVASLEDIKEKCSFASSGIEENVNNYINYETGTTGVFSNALAEIDPDNYRAISSNNQFYWGYVTETNSSPVRADASFFKLLKTGTYDEETNTFTLYNSDTKTTYTYNLNYGSLTTRIDGVSTTTGYVAYYYPPDCTDLSNINTITFLPGSGEHPSSTSYVLDNNCSVSTVLNSKTSAMIISPQDSQDYSKVANKVINSTEFAINFLDQNENCKNSLVGFSAGALSTCKIGSTTDTYDILVPVNGGGTFYGDTVSDKEIIIMESKNDTMLDTANNALYSINKLGGENVTVVTNNQNLLNNAESLGYNAQAVDDDKWDGHPSAWHMVSSSGLMEYLGNKR